MGFYIGLKSKMNISMLENIGNYIKSLNSIAALICRNNNSFTLHLHVLSEEGNHFGDIA